MFGAGCRVLSEKNEIWPALGRVGKGAFVFSANEEIPREPMHFEREHYRFFQSDEFAGREGGLERAPVMQIVQQLCGKQEPIEEETHISAKSELILLEPRDECVGA